MKTTEGVPKHEACIALALLLKPQELLQHGFNKFGWHLTIVENTGGYWLQMQRQSIALCYC